MTVSIGPKSSSRAISDSRSAVSTMVGPSIVAGGPGVGSAPVEDQLVAPSRPRDPPRRRRARGPRAPTSGQTSVASSAPGPTFSSAAAPRSASRTSSCLSRPPTRTATELARQRCPAAPKAELMIAATVGPRSASGITTSGVLGAAESLVALAGRGGALGDVARGRRLPDEGDASMPGWSRMELTASCAPWTRLQTPAGIASTPSISSKISSAGRGSRSEGLRMKALPMPIAKGRTRAGSSPGS